MLDEVFIWKIHPALELFAMAAVSVFHCYDSTNDTISSHPFSKDLFAFQRIPVSSPNNTASHSNVTYVLIKMKSNLKQEQSSHVMQSGL